MADDLYYGCPVQDTRRDALFRFGRFWRWSGSGKAVIVAFKGARIYPNEGNNYRVLYLAPCWVRVSSNPTEPPPLPAWAKADAA